MKILIYTDYYKQPSGFAREFKDILPYLEKDHEIAHVALDYNGYPLERGKLIVYPTKVESVRGFWAPEVILYGIEHFHPDIVFTIQDYYVLFRIAFNLAHPGAFKWVHWGLADGDPLGQQSAEPCRWVNQHIFQSEFARTVVKKAVPEIEGEVVYPSVDHDVFKIIGKKDDLKRQYKLDGRKIVVCVARNQLRKNIPLLLESFQLVVKKMPEAVLIIVGNTPKPASTNEDMVTSQNIEQFIVDMGLEDNVMLPKRSDGMPIDDDTVNMQYNLADVNILTSMGEGFGLPFIEAGINRVPSIGINHSAVKEAIGGGGLLVEPSGYVYTPDGVRQYIAKPYDVAEAIINLLQNDAMRIDLGEKAFKHAKELTPESRAKKLLEIFEQTIKNNVLPIALKK